MPSAVSGRQWPAESPTKKTPSSVAGAQPVRDPVALEAHRVGLHVGGQRQRRVLDVQARVERADADPQLVARRERPAVAGRDVAAVEPQLEVVAGRRAGAPPGRARARPPAAARSRRARAPAASRARPRSRARARRRGRCGRRCRCARSPWRSRTRRRRSGPTAGRTASGSRRSRTSTAAASGRSPEACGRAAIRTSGGSIQSSPRLLQPLGRGGARGGLPLADLVAVQDQHASRRSRVTHARPPAPRTRRRRSGRRWRRPRRSACARRRALSHGRA